MSHGLYPSFLLMAALGLAGLSESAAAPAPRRFAPQSYAQVRMWQSREAEVAVSGGWYSLKTFAGCMLAYQEGAAHPGLRIALCREERKSMRASTELELREVVLPTELATWNPRLACGYKESESAFHFPPVNGKRSSIWLIGLDDPNRLLSMNFSIVIVDQAEQIDFEQFRKAKGRCARQLWYPHGRIVLLLYPDHPEHWANQRYRFDLGSRVLQLQEKNANHRAEVIVCDPNDGRNLMTERSAEGLEDLEGVFEQRYRLNRWVAFEGAVYEKWEAAQHLVPPPDAWARWDGYPPPDWSRYCGIDFGYHPDPFVCQWWAKELATGRFYRYREIFRTQRLVEDHARDILEYEARELAALRKCAEADNAQDYASHLQRLHVVARYADHDREDRETLARHGVTTFAARKDIITGIQTVKALLNPAQEGGPKILLVRDALVGGRDAEMSSKKRPCTTEQEMAGYRWNQGTGAKRELPVDENNHGLDALRYVFHSLASGPRLRVWA